VRMWRAGWCVAAAVMALILCGAGDVTARQFRSRLLRRPSFRGRAVGAASSQTPQQADTVVPDTGSIDKAALKSVSADKFLALWHIFMRDVPVRVTEEPWTLFVPRNAALPPPGADGFLSSQAATRALLLRHAALGGALDPAAPPASLQSLAGPPLQLQDRRGATYVNGIKLTGDSFPAKNGIVIIIDGIIPSETSNSITTSNANRRRRPSSVQAVSNVIATTPRSNRRRRPVAPKIDITAIAPTTTTTLKPSRRRRPFVRRRFGPKRPAKPETTTTSTTTTTTTTQKPQPTIKPFDFKPVDGTRRSPLLFSKRSRKTSKSKNEGFKRKTLSSIPQVTKFHKFKKDKHHGKPATGRSLGQTVPHKISDANISTLNLSTNNEEPNNHDIVEHTTLSNNKEETLSNTERSAEIVFEDELQTTLEHTEAQTEQTTLATPFESSTTEVELTTSENSEQSTPVSIQEQSTTDPIQQTTENYEITTEEHTEAATPRRFRYRTTEADVEVTTLANEDTTPMNVFVDTVSEDETPEVPVVEETLETLTEADTESDQDHVAELPLLSFNKFVKITTNGDKYFSENATKIEESHQEFDEGVEFIPDSAFVPFNKFLNSERVSGNKNSTFELLVEEPMHDYSNSSSFMEWLTKQIKSRKQLGGKEFLNHLMESGVAAELQLSTVYTALVPTDEAFYAYYPIDYGFNIFLVDSFLNRTLREHLLAGSVVLEELEEGAQVPTLAGTTLTVARENGTLTVGGQPVLTESEVSGPLGRIYSLPALLHVSPQTVSSLKGLYPHLETGPLLGGPWPRSQFLSHLLQRLESYEDTHQPSVAAFAAILAQSHVAHLAMPHDDEGRRLEYTALVPSDEALESVLKEGRLTPEKRNNFVARHLLRGRLSLSDLPASAFNLLNATIAVARDGEGVTVGGARLLSEEDSIYNLGTLFVVNSTLAEDTPTVALSHRQPRIVTRTEYTISRRINDGPELPVAAQ